MSNDVSPFTVVTIGVFDGVHRGHQALLSEAKSYVRGDNSRLVVASFEPHPVSVLRPDSFLGLLTLPMRRAELLKECGADQVEFLHFDQQMSQMSADEFVEEVLVQGLNANVVVVGENFRFGHRALAGVEELIAFGAQYGFDVHLVKLAGGERKWSSTLIRQALLNGDVSTARDILSRPHRLTGEVVHGNHRGREIGYPTANVNAFGQLIIPADGIYAAMVSVGGMNYQGALSIGTNPTFDDVDERRVEVFILDQTDLDLYGQVIDVDVIEHIRDTEKFDSLDDLLVAMEQDIAKIREVLSDQA